MDPLSTVSAVLREDPVVSGAIDLFAEAAPQGYIVGGLIRNVAFSVQATARDIDIMYPDEVIPDIDQLHSEFLVRGLNRHGNLRFGYRGIHIDVFSPARFYSGFESVEAALSFFDVNINSMAISLDLEAFLDPLSAWPDALRRRCTLNIDRWNRTPAGMEQAVLRARLLSLFLRYQGLVCTNPSVATVGTEDLFRSYPNVVWHHTGLGPDEASGRLRHYLATGTLRAD